jgi:hypothetical protein
VFGVAILVKHILFNEEWTRDKISEEGIKSLFVALLFLFLFRFRLLEKIRNSHSSSSSENH